MGTSVDGFIRNSECFHIPKKDVRKALIVTQKMSELVDSANLDGLSVECFTLFEKTRITGCHISSFLNSLENVVARCEGDIPTIFAILLAKLITKKSVGIPV